MSGETGDDESGLTVDTLKMLMDERDRRYEERFKASEQAVEKAQVATEKRFEGVNEFRQALAEQTATFIPRAEAEAAINRNSNDIRILTDRINTSAGKGLGLNAAWLIALGLVAAFGTFVSIYVATR